MQYPSSGVVSRTKHIQISNKFFLIRHFKKRFQKSKKAVVLFSGFSVKGYEDERLKTLARAIASAGFNVYLPAIEDIENRNITTRIVEDMVQCINYVANKKKFNKKEKIAILAPSFSGSLAQIAATDERIRNKISAICAIGSYSSIEHCLQFILTGEDIDDYGRNILIKNILSFTDLEYQEEIHHLLSVAVQDNGLKRSTPQLPIELAKVNETCKRLWHKIQEDKKFRMQLLEEASLYKQEISIWKKELDVIVKTNSCIAPTFLLHGKDDKVISAQESVLLHNSRLQNNLPSTLLLTSLLDHGDTSLALKNWKEILMLSKFFSQFFKLA
ncbi:MAG: hypothetical protein H6579_00995 [Chitinophagales bacterium]|nr:hypothetical protein [Chitinophagales bacterium]